MRQFQLAGMFIAALLVFFCLTMAGCGGPEEAPEVPTDVVEEDPQPKPARKPSQQPKPQNYMLRARVGHVATGERTSSKHADHGIPYFSGSRAPVLVNDRWGYIDKEGKIVIEPQFFCAGSFSDGLACVCNGPKHGYIDTAGKLVIKYKFDDANDFCEGRACVAVGEFPNEEWGFIDTSGNFVVKPKYKSMELFFSEGLVAVKFGERYYGYLDRDGNVAIKPQFTSAESFFDGLAVVTLDGKDRFINKTGAPAFGKLATRSWGFSEGLADVAGLKAQIDFIDTSGKTVFEIHGAYSEAFYFSEGLAAARIAGSLIEKLVYMDRSGEIVILLDENCDRAGMFSEGLAPVRIDGKYGYIDKKGVMTIEPQFDFASKFVNGWALVSIGGDNYTGKIGYIDKTGEYIWKPTK